MEQNNNGFDRNQLMGFLLIGAILIFFGWWQSKYVIEPEEATETTSVTAVETPEATATEVAETVALVENTVLDTTSEVEVYENKTLVLENDVLRLDITSMGAAFQRVQLKEFETYYNEELNFVHANQVLDLQLPDGTGVASMPFNVVEANERSIALAYQGTTVNITLPETGYELSYIVSGNTKQSGKPSIFWERKAMATEKGIKNERIYSTIVYRDSEDQDVDKMSMRGGDDADDIDAVDWIAQKQHFFSGIVRPEGGFSKATIATVNGEDSTVIKDYSVRAELNSTVSGAYTIPLHIYYGPNHYHTLKEVGHTYEEVIDFGWGIFGWIGRGVVVPIFNWLEGYGLGYGLIIFIMVLIIKMTLLPLTYTSYKSQAKMRVLKPQIDAIGEKFKGKDDMKKQQATMDLYREAGVNPLGGCIPMLVQMPILFAMFRFFPASIELRGEAFLWATDLSTYDAIVSWSGHIPILSTLYGNHISLFTILMTVSTLMYTWMNNQMTGAANNSQFPQMKYMMYGMPLIFMFALNSFPAGLTYYYFLSNIVTFSQQFIIRKTIDDDAILAKIEAKKANPKGKKKSKFQQRLEEMQKQQQSKARR